MTKEKEDITELLNNNMSNLLRIRAAIAYLNKMENNFGFSYLNEILFLSDDHLNEQESLLLKTSLLKTWLEKNHPGSVTELVNVFQQLPSYLIYNPIFIAQTSAGLFKEENPILPLAKITQLCQELYPLNDILQTSLMENFIGILAINGNHLEIVRDFIQEIAQDKEVADLLWYYKTTCNLKNYQILKVLEGRISPNHQHQVLGELIGDRKCSYGFLSKWACLEITNSILYHDESGSHFGLNHLKNTNLCDLVSYFWMFYPKEYCETLLVPEIRREMAKNLISLDSKIYISKAEFLKIETLIGLEYLQELPQLAYICDHFKNIVPVISLIQDSSKQVTNLIIKNPLSQEVTNINLSDYHINLGANSNFTNEETTYFGQINQRFKSLLNGDYSGSNAKSTSSSSQIKNPEDVVLNFLADALKMPDLATNTKPENKIKLLAFFAQHKAHLAYLFLQDGGIDDFSALVTSLIDGCTANIGTQMELAVTKSLLKNCSPSDQTLYSFISQEVIIPIINKGNDILHASGDAHFDPLQNQVIRDYYLLPSGLAKKMLGSHAISNKKEENEREVVKRLREEDGGNEGDILTKKAKKDANNMDEEEPLTGKSGKDEIAMEEDDYSSSSSYKAAAKEGKISQQEVNAIIGQLINDPNWPERDKPDYNSLIKEGMALGVSNTEYYILAIGYMLKTAIPEINRGVYLNSLNYQLISIIDKMRDSAIKSELESDRSLKNILITFNKADLMWDEMDELLRKVEYLPEINSTSFRNLVEQLKLIQKDIEETDGYQVSYQTECFLNHVVEKNQWTLTVEEIAFANENQYSNIVDSWLLSSKANNNLLTLVNYLYPNLKETQPDLNTTKSIIDFINRAELHLAFLGDIGNELFENNLFKNILLIYAYNEANGDDKSTLSELLLENMPILSTELYKHILLFLEEYPIENQLPSLESLQKEFEESQSNNNINQEIYLIATRILGKFLNECEAHRNHFFKSTPKDMLLFSPAALINTILHQISDTDLETLIAGKNLQLTNATDDLELEIAAYFLLENITPKLLEHPELVYFISSLQNVFNEAANEVETEQKNDDGREQKYQEEDFLDQPPSSLTPSSSMALVGLDDEIEKGNQMQ